MRLARALGATLALIGILAADMLAISGQAPAQAANAELFQPGYIVSDGYFFDGNAMAPMDVAKFLAQQVPACRTGYTCLRDYVQTTPAMPAEDGLCAAYPGGLRSGAEIISMVGQACGISQKALLVLLQKEQSLITDDWPSPRQYASATGYSCPDTAPCDPSYAGFFYQVYNAARQLRNYGLNPDRFNFHAGMTANILFNPNRACGSSSVYLQNRATAALYNYTPYQPNTAALQNLYGVGDSCSAYGNRNFWRLWTDWFGSPTVAPGTPEGSLIATGVPGGITVSGWVVDSDAVGNAVSVAIQVGASWQSVVANQSGKDLSSSYPGAGTNHYFSAFFAFDPGDYLVCGYAPNTANAGAMGNLGCKGVTATLAPEATGSITNVEVTPGSITMTGWAVRPDVPTGGVNVAATVGATWVSASTGIADSNAPGAFPGAGKYQGFKVTMPVSAGQTNACVWVSKTGKGATSIGCRSVTVPVASATRVAIQTMSVTNGSLSLTGWAAWPDNPTASVRLALNMGSSWIPIDANQTNPAAGAAIDGAGNAHGFSATVRVPVGVTQVCLWTNNQSLPASVVSCRSIASLATTINSQGNLESVWGGAGTLNFTGWAAWLNADSASVRVAANVGSTWIPIQANRPNASAHATNNRIGPNHGFEGSLPFAPGNYNVCFWMVKAEGGSQLLECRQVTVRAPRDPVIQIQTAVAGTGGVYLDGWASLPDSPASQVRLAANIGSKWYPIDAGSVSAAAVGTPPARANQPFRTLIPTAPGLQQVCLWAAGPNGNKFMGCQNVVVQPTPAVVGKVTSAIGVSGGVQITGWAVWPSRPTAQVNVASVINNLWTATPTRSANSDAQAWVVGAGPNQGFSGLIPARSGAQNICVYAARPAANAVVLDCRTVVVP